MPGRNLARHAVFRRVPGSGKDESSMICFIHAPQFRTVRRRKGHMRRCACPDSHAAGSQHQPMPHVAAVCHAAQLALWWRARERLSGASRGAVSASPCLLAAGLVGSPGLRALRANPAQSSNAYRDIDRCRGVPTLPGRRTCYACTACPAMPGKVPSLLVRPCARP